WAFVTGAQFVLSQRAAGRPGNGFIGQFRSVRDLKCLIRPTPPQLGGTLRSRACADPAIRDSNTRLLPVSRHRRRSLVDRCDVLFAANAFPSFAPCLKSIRKRLILQLRKPFFHVSLN